MDLVLRDELCVRLGSPDLLHFLCLASPMQLRHPSPGPREFAVETRLFVIRLLELVTLRLAIKSAELHDRDAESLGAR